MKLNQMPLIGYMINWYKNYRRKGGMQEIFTDYYKENYWSSDESLSGSGSETQNVKNIINALPDILSEINAKSILDIPCGDFNWMKHVDLSSVNYIGADIVEDVIERNKRYEDENIKFIVVDICASNLPKVDMIFSRDCLVHLSNKDIKNAINNVKESGSSYFLSTTFTKRKKNKDIKTGFWRPINLQLEPFNFPEPIEIFNEGFSKRFGRHSDKSLGLWRISDLQN